MSLVPEESLGGAVPAGPVRAEPLPGAPAWKNLDFPIRQGPSRVYYERKRGEYLLPVNFADIG
jgi:hypothetical protein